MTEREIQIKVGWEGFHPGAEWLHRLQGYETPDTFELKTIVAAGTGDVNYEFLINGASVSSDEWKARLRAVVGDGPLPIRYSL